MREHPTPSRSGIVLSVASLFGFAIAQPLLDVFGRNAEFFVARNAPAVDLVAFALILGLALPLALAAIVLGVRRLNARAGSVVHGIVIFSLAGVVAVRIGKGRLDGLVVLVIGAIAGAVVLAAYRRSPHARKVVHIAAVIGPLSALLFLFGSPASKLVLPQAGAAVATGAITRPAPIVFIVLDEFPLASLMDRKERIDRVLYPNFARLAREGTWYRNATTAHQSTDRSVPSILTGTNPDNDKLPLFGDHPVNLFSRLRGAYSLTAIEPITRLCPTDLCGANDVEQDFGSRWNNLARDVGIVAGHMYLPERFARTLPSIDQSWGSFGQADATANDPEVPRRDLRERFRAAISLDRPEEFRKFVQGIRQGRPSVSFLHTMLPHPPWQYLGDGKRYTEAPLTPGAGGRQLTVDDRLVVQAYQRHLLQAQLVDGLVGEMISHLVKEEMYDETLIVVTSDHGASFTPGVLRRVASPITIGEVAPVPLFIKRPQQARGGADDRPALTIDIVPTIGDILGADPPWRTDGISLVGPRLPGPRPRTVLANAGTETPVSSDGRELSAAVEHKYSLFASRADSIDVYRPRPYDAMIGARVAEFSRGTSAYRGGLDDPEVDRAVGLRRPRSVSLIEGRVRGADRRYVAVAVNGRVAAFARTYLYGGKPGKFYVLVPPSMLREGRNEIRLYEITGARSLSEIVIEPS